MKKSDNYETHPGNDKLSPKIKFINGCNLLRGRPKMMLHENFGFQLIYSSFGWAEKSRLRNSSHQSTISF
jgi:hypothetical protein